MTIKIGSLTASERRETKAMLTYEEDGAVRAEEIRLSFKKPTEALWNKLAEIENQEGQEKKTVRVEQLLVLDVQSPDITNDDGTVHQITRADLEKLDIAQLSEFWDGVKTRFFLQAPESTSETNTKSTSAQTAG